MIDVQLEDALLEKTLIVIDDRLEILELVKSLFYSYCDVLTFTNPENFYDSYLKDGGKADVIITDVVIGPYNGTTFLEQMLNENRWIPTVIMTGSIGYPTIINYFEQGYVLEGNDLPLALALKKPGSFSQNLLNRVKQVVSPNRSDKDGIGDTLKAIKNPWQDNDYTMACEELLSKYFSICVATKDTLEQLKEYSTENDQTIFSSMAYNELQRNVEMYLHLGEIISDPVNSLHVISSFLVTNISYLETLEKLLRPYEDDNSFADGFNALIKRNIRFGEYLAKTVDSETLLILREKHIEQLSGHRQVSAVNILRMERGLKPLDNDPLNKFRRNLNQEKEYTILLVHDDAVLHHKYFDPLGKVDTAGVFYQAVNALANAWKNGAGYDLMLVHPALKEFLADSRHPNINFTVKESNFTLNLTQESRDYLNEAEKRIKDHPIYHVFLGMLDNSGEYLALIARVMHPNMKIVALDNWSEKGFLANSSFGENNPYDKHLGLKAITKEEDYDTYQKPLIALLSQ